MWLREARYVPAADGVRLAAYVFRPSGAGPWPVLWTHNLYNRSALSESNRRRWIERFPALALAPAAPPVRQLELPDHVLGLVRHGYALAVVDARGSGASFGTRDGPFSPAESLDAKHVTQWLAAQPWCNGRVGMFGRSYMGANQHTAAATSPRGLCAILPEMAPFDLYSAVRGGGIFRHDFARSWFDDLRRRDRHDAGVPVDGDREGTLLARARDEHRANRDLYEMFARLAHRDSVDEETGARPYLDNNPGHDGSLVRQPGVPAYHIAGWFDPFVRDSLLWYENIDGTKRLTIGPWAHSGSAGIDLAEVYRAWFDHWLRATADGDRPASGIDYYTIGSPAGERWRSAESWPPAGHEHVTFCLAGGPSGTCASVNDGVLAKGGRVEPTGRDEYVVDYASTAGRSTRWTNAYGGPFGYPDMSANDARGLTYTSEPLAEARELTGHPVASLWVSSTADDVDVFAYLEEVSPRGSSTYVSEGALRASHRALHRPPYAGLGLPYHRSFRRDCEPLGDAPAELALDLLPTSWRFAKDSRIRLTITCADRDNASTPVFDPPPRMVLHRDRLPGSRLVLPLRRRDACA